MATREEILANFDPQGGETSGYITASDQKAAAGGLYDTFSPLLTLPSQLAPVSAQVDQNESDITSLGSRVSVLEARYPVEHNHDGEYGKWWKGTQAQYNALPTKDPNTLYVITG